MIPISFVNGVDQAHCRGESVVGEYIVKSVGIGVWVVLEEVPRDGGEVEVEWGGHGWESPAEKDKQSGESVHGWRHDVDWDTSMILQNIPGNRLL